MKGNTNKYHLLLNIRDSIIEKSTCEKLLGVKIGSKLRFDDHIQDLCNKANRKLRALARATPYMNPQKRSFNECLFQCTIQLLSFDLDAS